MAKTTADFPLAETVTTATEFLVRQGGNRRLSAISLDEYIKSLIPGEGLDGREIEMRATATELQWRYVGSPVWNALLQLATLQGNDGKDVEMRVTGEKLQWRSGEGAWVDLLELGDLTANAVPAGGATGQVLAKSSSADGAVEWRTIKDGGVPEFRTTATHLQWRLVGDTTWINLITLADLQSPGVPKGGTVGQILVKATSADYNYVWQTPQTPQLQATATHIQWKYTTEATWTNLVALADITGKNVEFRSNTTHIQWRVVGDATWINLVALATLKGDTGIGVPAGGTTGQILAKSSAGDYLTTWIDAPTGGGTGGGENGKNPEFQKSTTHIQWRLVGSSTWIDLVPLADITGADGKPVELQTSATHIQWRVQGTATWTNLVALSTLKGVDGQGVPVGGTAGQVLVKTASGDYVTAWQATPNAPNGVPTGGTAGQILSKSGTPNYAMSWVNAPIAVPTGGTAGQLLAKSSNADGALSWVTPSTGGGANPLPTGGTVGQVLAKSTAADYAVQWVAATSVPAGGTTGQLLAKATDADGAVVWVDAPKGGSGGSTTNGLPTGGTVGQVLTKNSTADFAAQWSNAANPNAQLPSGGSTGMILAKSADSNYQVSWVAAPAAANGLPRAGQTGQILAKSTGGDYSTEWIDAPSGGGSGSGGGVDLTSAQLIKGIKTFFDPVIINVMLRFVNFNIVPQTVASQSIQLEQGAALVGYDIAAAGLQTLSITLPGYPPSGYEFTLCLTGGTVGTITWSSGAVPWGDPKVWSGKPQKTGEYLATTWRFNGNTQQWYQI